MGSSTSKSIDIDAKWERLAAFEHGDFVAVYLKTKQKILLFYQQNRFVGIYDIATQEHKIKNVKYPHDVKPSFFVAVNNDNYIIIGGGYPIEDGCIGYGYTDLIFLWNVKRMKFVKCRMKCPEKNAFHAIVMDSDIEYKTFMVHAYLRWLSVEEILYLSGLMKIMGMYYYEECLYILDRDVKSHWKMQIRNILSAKH